MADTEPRPRSNQFQPGMSSIAKVASTKLDWAKLISSLGLTGSTAASLTAFKKRYEDASKENFSLKNEATTVDFKHYRSILKNTDVIDQLELAVKLFKPITYDVDKILKNISFFEAKAVENAKLTEKAVLSEIDRLQITLKDIECARPFDQLTVDDIVKARPDVEDKVTYMVKNGKWEVPCYRETFGTLSAI